jgi:hypothetical protein
LTYANHRSTNAYTAIARKYCTPQLGCGSTTLQPAVGPQYSEGVGYIEHQGPELESTIYRAPAQRCARAHTRHRVRITTMRGWGAVRSFDPGSVTRGTVCLTSVCIQADLKAVVYSQATGSLRPRPSPRETFEEAFKSFGTCG